MNFPTLEQAKQIFEDVISKRNQSPFPFTNQQEETFRQHCQNVVSAAKLMASAILCKNCNQ